MTADKTKAAAGLAVTPCTRSIRSPRNIVSAATSTITTRGTASTRSVMSLAGVSAGSGAITQTV
jgi:hypothetical protein